MIELESLVLDWFDLFVEVFDGIGDAQTALRLLLLGFWLLRGSNEEVDQGSFVDFLGWESLVIG